MFAQGLLLTDPGETPQRGWIRIEGDRIAEVGQGEPPKSERSRTVGDARCVLSPGFVDAHIHLPQIDSVGCDGMPLLDWLRRVIYPAEVWWGAGAAKRLASVAVNRMLREGTLGFAGYLTSHGDVNAEVVRALASGIAGPARLRFIVGRVAMDRNAPNELTREDRWRTEQSPIPSPLLPAPDGLARRGEISANPRFAVACSDELLAEVGWLCQERVKFGGGLVVQTHLAESRDECEEVRRLFPGDPHYTGVYDRFGLLRPRTVLAHCVHLSDDEWRLIAERGCVVAHCPTANVFLQSGLFDLDAARRHAVRLALGSDIAAGADVAMPRVARAMIETAKARRLTTSPSVYVPTPADAWRIITRDNADALGWTDAGRLEPGAAADVLVLRPPETWIDEHLVGRLIYNWSPDLIEARIVEGRLATPDAPRPRDEGDTIRAGAR